MASNRPLFDVATKLATWEGLVLGGVRDWEGSWDREEAREDFGCCAECPRVPVWHC